MNVTTEMTGAKKMKRTDVHKPSLANPADYRFEACFYQGASDAMMKSYMEDMKEYDAARGFDHDTGEYTAPMFEGNYAAKMTCDHCGAHFNHGVLFKHIPSGEHVHIGHICASDTIGLPSKAAATKRTAEKAAAREAARRAAATAATAWRAENLDVVIFLARVDMEVAAGTRKPHDFLVSMSRNLAQYGSLFDNAANAVRKFEANDATFEARAAEREAKMAAEKEAEKSAAPVTAGRQEIAGEVLKTEWRDYGDGDSRKVMYLRAVDGNRYWGTVPKAILEAERGDLVSFTASVEPAKDDEHMGFYKRPTGGTMEKRS